MSRRKKYLLLLSALVVLVLVVALGINGYVLLRTGGRSARRNRLFPLMPTVFWCWAALSGTTVHPVPCSTIGCNGAWSCMRPVQPPNC